MHPLANPLVLRIPGEFWDTQIYSGRLYLFNVDGSITTLDWDRMLDEWEIPAELRLPFDCAFRQSDYLYGEEWSLFFNDPEVTGLLASKFTRLQSLRLEPTAAMLLAATVKQQDNPFPFPHADATIYDNEMYVVSQDGLFHANVKKRRVYPIFRQASRMWDGNVVGIAASYGTVALAGGVDGLFQRRVNSRARVMAEPEQLSKIRCDRCAWAYWSIFGSSYTHGGYLAEFNRRFQRYEVTDDEPYFPDDPPIRRLPARDFVELIGSEEIFGRQGYAWAGQDKIYTAAMGELWVAVYDPYAEEDRQRGRGSHRDRPKIRQLGGEALNGLGGKKIIGAEVARFGTIVEGQDELIVFLSNGERFPIPGEFSRWRIFPRAKHYENQLHIVYDDHLAIYSFNQDYFVEQTSKRFGMRVYGMG